jgi:uncharacterized protein YciI
VYSSTTGPMPSTWVHEVRHSLRVGNAAADLDSRTLSNVRRMISVLLSFNNDPARLELRPAHRARLAGLQESGALLAAGPFADESGALLIFRCGEDEVRSELRADPYYSAPGVEVRDIREWNPVVGP